MSTRTRTRNRRELSNPPRIRGKKSYTIDEIAELASVLGVRKNTPSSTALGTQSAHGPLQGGVGHGLFSYPGAKPEMFSTIVRPRTLSGILGVVQSEYENEILEVMTGQTEAEGENSDGFCDDAPTVGKLKVCQQVYRFGAYRVKTELNSVPQIGMLRDRADVGRRILNEADRESPFTPDVISRFPADTRSQLGMEFYRVGIQAERDFEQIMVTGNAAATGGDRHFGFIREFNGLDSLIKTGHVDAVTGTACPSMDSAIITFDADVTETIGGGDGRNIVQSTNELYSGLRERADRMGMGDVQWAWVMRYDQFVKVVEAYACDYATYRCSVGTSAGNPNTVDAVYTNTLRMQMLEGNYLLINNIAVPVIFSEGIPRTTVSANTYSADMYLVPVSWRGMTLLDLEYFNQGNPYASEMANYMGTPKMMAINNGLWLVGEQHTAYCIEYHFAAQMRLVLRAPWLAGRIDNVSYVSRVPFREAIPGSSFYANGGDTYRI